MAPMMVAAIGAAVLSAGYTKLQEEVAADWFALVSFTALSHAGDPRVAGFAGPGLPDLPFKAPRDKTVGSEFSQQLRVEVFEEMREALAAGRTLKGPAWWMAEARSRDIGGMDLVFLILAMAAPALAAVTLSGPPVATLWLAAPALTLGMIACVLHLYKAFNASTCDAVLAERAPGALDRAFREMEEHRRSVAARDIFARVVDGLGRREMYRAQAETEGDVDRQVRASLNKLALAPLEIGTPPDRNVPSSDSGQ